MEILIKAFSKAIFISALLLEAGQVFAKKNRHITKSSFFHNLRKYE